MVADGCPSATLVTASLLGLPAAFKNLTVSPREPELVKSSISYHFVTSYLTRRKVSVEASVQFSFL